MKKILAVFALCFPLALFAQPSVQQEATGFIGYNKDRVLALANKFSEAQYDWRPAEGVRSVGEVMLHLAGSNYFFMQASGYTLPEGLDPQSFEQNVKGKTQIIETVTASYTFLTEHIGQMQNDQLGDKVEFPWPGNHTKLTAILLSVDHTSEHLGQLIAYARMNGITPPWSEGGN